ncbi:translation factor GUF1 homolog, mitochondrial [Lutzomyia longipalpis]|uniref:translation factor GUF1 homolog, mitochondrial n=1 Tax=Lutzomyia longipalpis TaxID=7200 RepID=UPI002483C2A8|nr:translation factor GUF1 homolog, mitochondrial [Lutzomyia longipalpis]
MVFLVRSSMTHIRMSSYCFLKHLRSTLCGNSSQIPRNNLTFPWRKFSSANAEIEEKLRNIPLERIRNFCIIAHVDHGKSTLADRLLEKAGLRIDRPQILDSLQVEKERGITVKAQTVSLFYRHGDVDYLLNLIDTPGHVDFSNEVHRSLAPCDGAILLVDANHGIQAQTVSNYFMAATRNLKILPILNKIDLRNANPTRTCEELQSMFDIPPESVLKISAKLGTGMEAVIPSIIERLPAPNTHPEAHFRALLFDSSFDRYRGALSLINVRDGEIRIGQEITSVATGKTYEVKTLSLLTPAEVPVACLRAGHVGLLGCNMRSGKEAVIGDTIHHKGASVTALPGFRPQQAMVFAGVYPPDQSKYISLRAAIEKLTLNDSAVTVSPDSNSALGQGWRLGFLGLLHMEVFCQRLEQEYDAEPIITAPSVTYKVRLHGTKVIKAHGGAEMIDVSNPALLPDSQHIAEFHEPLILATIITPTEFIGSVIGLCVERRGVQKTSTHIDSDRVMMTYIFPLSEIVLDFYDHLKSLTSGYASFDYEDHGYALTNAVKLRILLNGQDVEELSTIVHASKATTYARQLVAKLKEIIPRQMILIAIQAAVGGKILARETIKPFRKDVTAKLYGGDVTRRMKLLRQQAEGKKKMRSIANISIPRDTFISILKR